MDKMETSRRGVLGALALGTLAGGATFAAMPASSGSMGPSRFAASMARYRAAKAAEDHFDSTIYAAAIRACDQAEEAFDEANPHKVFLIAGREISTDNWRNAEFIRREITSIRYMERCCWDDHRNDMAFLDAYDARKAAREALPERQHLDAMTRQGDKLCDAMCKERDAAVTAPVTSLDELLAKFNLLDESDRWNEDIGEPAMAKEALRADIQRLAAGGLN